jgi:MATE family multidrug resistance protein
VPTALLQATMVRMARARALDDPGLRRAVVACGLVLGLGGGTLLLAALAAGAQPLAHGFFDASPAGLAAAGLAAQLLVLLGLMELLAGPGLAAAGLLRGQRDTRAPMLFSLIGHWAVGAPLGLLLCEAMGLGIVGVWIGLTAGMSCAALLTLARLARRPA